MGSGGFPVLEHLCDLLGVISCEAGGQQRLQPLEEIVLENYPRLENSREKTFQ